MALTDNQTAYWKLDESSGSAADATGNGKTLINTGSVTYGTGKINNGAIGTNTTGGYLSISDAISFTAASTNTWNLWYKPNNMLGYLLDNITASGDAKRFILYEDSSTSKVHMFASGNEVLSGALTVGTWYMLTVTKNGSNWQFFVNGTSVGTTTTGSGSYSGGVGFMLLNSLYTGGSTTNSTIDEVGTWSRVLSGSEITQLYNSGSGLQYPYLSYNSSIDRRRIIASI